MSKTLDYVCKFVGTERNRFAGNANNLFAFAFSQFTVYYEYLLIILDRYDKVDKEFSALMKAWHESIMSKTPNKSGPITEQEQKLLNQQRRLTILLHLEIKSFYLFAKILLDKIAKAVKFYFGEARKCSVESHHDLFKSVKKYIETKGLKPPQERMLILMEELQKDVVDYRDDHIVHKGSARDLEGTGFSFDGKKSRIFKNRIYPKATDSQVESKSPHEIMPLIDEYIKEIVDYVSANKEKCSLKTI